LLVQVLHQSGAKRPRGSVSIWQSGRVRARVVAGCPLPIPTRRSGALEAACRLRGKARGVLHPSANERGRIRAGCAGEWSRTQKLLAAAGDRLRCHPGNAGSSNPCSKLAERLYAGAQDRHQQSRTGRLSERGWRALGDPVARVPSTAMSPSSSRSVGHHLRWRGGFRTTSLRRYSDHVLDLSPQLG